MVRKWSTVPISLSYTSPCTTADRREPKPSESSDAERPLIRLRRQGVRATVAKGGVLASSGWSQFPRLRDGRDWRELIDGEGASTDGWVGFQGPSHCILRTMKPD
jgi:hypothetical protein